MWKVSTRWLAAGLGIVLVASLSGPASSAPSTVPGVPHDPQEERVVPVRPIATKQPGKDAVAEAALRLSPAVSWPAAGVAEVSPGKALTGAGGLPVRVGSGKTGLVRVEVLDRAAATKAGIKGLVLRVRRADGVAQASPLSLTVGYGAFRHAFGANWGDRLRLVRLSDNAFVPSRNDKQSATVTADLDVSGHDSDYALMAGPSGGTGNFGATPLALSASWQVSGQTGDFSWNYPLRMPETPGNLTPQLALAYSSGSVDGRTASTNNQPSWAGEGFDLWSGYIERSYKGCGDDLATGQQKTGDQCWLSDNATMSLAGHSGQLIRDDATGVWRLKSDDGSRIEKLTGASNGDNDNEYWKVTTRDGIQYFFGSKADTQSTWTAPVFGNHAGEPCHGATFDASWCKQAYRWNLDYVVDTHDNTVTYHYSKFANSYGLNMGRETVAYDRGGILLRADFGTKRGSEGAGTAPARVVFGTADRCLPNANCALHNPQSYPDVPFDQECNANCTNQVSPTFWTTKRLASITTYAGATAVETWTLNHSYPNPGDGTNAGLWLSGINHSGLVGGTIALPQVTFGGLALPNRVNSATDGLPPMNKYRIVAVHNEFGGVVGVSYAPANCSAGALPTPDSNTLRCFPVYWQPDGAQALTDWMHKYIVSSVVQVDQVGGSPTEVTSYDYHGGGAWHYADNEMVNADRRTWSEWRGYEKVVVRKGDPAGLQSSTEYRYFRGMNADRLSGGGTRSVSIMDSQGGSVPDEDQLNGVVREKITYNGFGGAVLGSTVNDVWQRGPTATRGSLKAFMVETAAVRDRTALSGGAWRGTRINRSYNNDGLITQIDDLGDVNVAGDEECTRTWYARNESTRLISLPSRVQTVGVPCAAIPSFPADAISDLSTYYDGSNVLGAAPSAGNPTRVDQLAEYQGGQPVYVTATKTTFDGYGRPLDSFDALGRKTSTAYAETDGLTTKLTITNPLGHLSTAELAPAWGEPTTAVDANGRRTDVRYDALGRVTGVWLPGRSEPAGEGPNLRYRYLMRNNGPSAVSTDTLRANGNYVSNHALYDGFLRPRQTQSPGWGEGRVITDTIYDARGYRVKDNGQYYAEGAPGTTLVAAGDNNIPSQTVTVHDGAGRVTTSIFRSLAVEKWRSSTAYFGDHIDHTPPPGGTATTVYLDADGRTTALHQYRGSTPTGPADVTTYTYTKTGKLASFTDPAENQWRHGYDLRGRRTAVHDPDQGDSNANFDAAGQLLTATDARNKTLWFKFDDLGRKTEEREGSATGTLRAKWTYDSLLKGLLTSSTRVEGGNAYTTAVVGYDSASRPTGTKLTVPASDGSLAGTYQTDVTYRPDGSLASVALPRAGDLAPETITYTYDDLGLPKTTGGSAAYVNDTWYTRFGELAQFSMGGAGARVWNTLYYEEDTRRLARSLIERERTTGSQVNDFRYRYDPAGNVTQISDVPEGGPADVQCFAHDHLRRLTEAWTTAGVCAPRVVGGTTPYWTSYGYDLTGNRTNETQHGLGGTADITRVYSYSSAGHALSSVTTSGPTGSKVDSFTYDASGNTITRNLAGSTQTLAWDTSGRLTSAAAADGRARSIGYDADGVRLVRRDPTATTLYLSGQEIRLDRTTGVKTGTRFYSHGRKAVAVRTGTGLYWQAGDHHGTATSSVKADTLAVTRRLFTPFGDSRGTAPSSWPDELGFVGGTRDDSLGLTQLGARHYDAKTGRFISIDPIADPSDPQQLNGYAYGNNSPATYSDPDGLFPSCDCEADRYGYDNVLHNGDGSLLSESDANKYLSPKQKDKWKKKVQRKGVRDEEKRRYDAGVKASGHSKKEYDEAKKIKEKSVLDVVIEAGGAVLREFLGIDDIKGCFGNGDVGACISMVINAVPWTKIFRIGELVSAVRKAWKAITSFRDKQKHADDVINAVDKAVAKCAVHSFRPETPVRMADGSSKPIGKIELGDKVLATDPGTNATHVQTVVALHINTDYHLVEVDVRTADGKGTLHTTENHPFWLDAENIWVDAGQLRAGDQLRAPDGTRVEVVSVRRYIGKQVMRDLTIDSTHTYYVLADGNTPVLVHNDGGAFPDRSLPRDQHGVPVPDSQYPHTQLGQNTGRKVGNYGAAREFGENGRPVRDIHFTDHGRPQNHPNPHQHDFVDNPTGGTSQHGPARPLEMPSC